MNLAAAKTSGRDAQTKKPPAAGFGPLGPISPSPSGRRRRCHRRSSCSKISSLDSLTNGFTFKEGAPTGPEPDLGTSSDPGNGCFCSQFDAPSQCRIDIHLLHSSFFRPPLPSSSSLFPFPLSPPCRLAKPGRQTGTQFSPVPPPRPSIYSTASAFVGAPWPPSCRHWSPRSLCGERTALSPAPTRLKTRRARLCQSSCIHLALARVPVARGRGADAASTIAPKSCTLLRSPGPGPAASARIALRRRGLFLHFPSLPQQPTRLNPFSHRYCLLAFLFLRGSGPLLALSCPSLGSLNGLHAFPLVFPSVGPALC